MSKATDIIKRVAEQTDRILLFHSATGKDSIVMLDLCAPIFKEVVCVFMYVVPNLQCVNRHTLGGKHVPKRPIYPMPPL